MSDSPAQVTGRFTTPESARNAMTRLESAGFDADDVMLEGLPQTVNTKESANQADLDATGDVAKGAATAGGIGGTVAAVVGGVAGAVVAGPPGAIAGAAAGGAAGAALGGFYGGASKVPVNEDAWETYEMDPSVDHPIQVVVRVSSREDAAKAKHALAAADDANDVGDV